MKRRQISLSFKSKGKDELLYEWLKDMYAPPAYIKQVLWNTYMQECHNTLVPNRVPIQLIEKPIQKPIEKHDRLLKDKKRNVASI